MFKNLYCRWGYRVLDLTIVFLAAPVFLPIFLIMTLLIRAKLGAPIFFRQTRTGYAGKPFDILKFRSMTDERDVAGRLLPDAYRLTRFGHLLRRSSIDELPQLRHVMRGEMSLIGPRPLVTLYLDRYTARQMLRHNVTPGLTGWAQINGRNAVSWEEKFEMDVWYAENKSLWLDLKILAMTIAIALRQDGIGAEGQVTGTEFMGSAASHSRLLQDSEQVLS